MYCMKCGAELPDEAGFCRECGSPQELSTDSAHRLREWELCQIQFEQIDQGGFFRGPRGIFCARIVGRDRTPVLTSREVPMAHVGGGGIWPDLTERAIEQIVASLTWHLTREGWEPLGQGGRLTWEHRFRRAKPKKRT